MARTRPLRAWTLAVTSAVAFGVCATGDQIVRAVSVEISGQEPQPQQDPEAPTGRGGGRGGAAAPPNPRPYAR